MAERNAEVPVAGAHRIRASASISVTSLSRTRTSSATGSTSRRGWKLWPSRAASASRGSCATRCATSFPTRSRTLGSRSVKNIARPVEVYRVDLGADVLPTPSRWRESRLRRGSWRWVAAGVVVAGVAGIAVWALPQLWKTAAPSPGPPRFSVAILPFAAATASPADEQFAEALTNDLTVAMGRGYPRRSFRRPTGGHVQAQCHRCARHRPRAQRRLPRPG